MLSVTRRTGEIIRITEAALVAGKTVPAAPARRRSPATSAPELDRVAARGWPPVESEWLGGWQLRASAGFTRRANSVAPLGDPGLPLDTALEQVRSWYAQRSLPAYIQVSTGAQGTQEDLAAGLDRRGWTREVTAETRTAALAPVGDLDADVSRVALTRETDAQWLARYRRSGEPGPEVVAVLHGGPSVWFASVPDEAGGAAAIGRCVVDGRWAGFAAVEVGPEHRRRGLATAVMAALARKALDEGASAAYLQVETDNHDARALYDRLGFVTHHHYHHWRAPQGGPS
ncbi:acetyltransferase [Streptomyces sp. CB02923]|nr:acetyltransferase [Streptomyces sp. CB02923]